MESQRSSIGNAEDNMGIPDDLRCKRSDGKQWRCTAMSMPDKTVCEKHYIQAKKRAANSALRASLKKAKRKPSGESDVNFDSKSDDLDISLDHVEVRETSTSGRKTKEKLPKSVHSSPDSPPLRRLIHRNSSKLNNDHYGDAGLYAGKQMSYRIPASCMVDSSRNVPQRSFDSSAVGSEEELSDADTESSDDGDGLICHQCRRAAKVVWCLKCDRRGFCARCISTWYSDIPLEELQKSCPACRSTCTCKACLKADNLIKAKIREIHVLDKLQYLHCLLSSVLPFVRQIRQEQCDELALEKKLHGTEGVLERTKLNADEQMCCDCCRVPIVDFHRHCPKCSYDLCLSCCQDLREASMGWNMDDNVENHASIEAQDKDTPRSKLRSSRNILLLGVKYPGWRANSDGSIPCLPRQHGGCGLRSLTLRRIFKLNWVGKLVKNLEEMVSGCNINVDASSPEMRLPTSIIRQCAYREDTQDNFLYCPSSEDIQAEGIHEFRNQWVKGKPAIVRLILDDSSIASWDPMVLWRQIHETTDERMRDANRIVKAVDCLDWSEVDIQLGQLIRGYSEGQINKNGWPQMLKLKDWPSPSATEEFLMYQRPEFISKLPLLEFIHSKWGLLNVAAKLPHYSLQNDAGPKIIISYGTSEELGFGDSVTNLHLTMRDTAYLLVHSSEIKRNGWKKQNSGRLRNADEAADSKGSPELPPSALDITSTPELYNYGHSRRDKCSEELDISKDGKLGDRTTNSAEENTSDSDESDKGGEFSTSESSPGALWDVFRREDVAKLTDYIYAHWNELGRPISANSGHFQVTRPLYAEAVYLNSHHKRRIKEEFGIEPWSFEQHVGHAVFIPAGCPFQVRNLQSTVQLAFDFLSPESLEEAVNMAEEIRCLPNDHSAKLQMMEVGKISLYAASSAIKEVQKLVLDPKLGAELGFEDPNLTAKVSENLEKMVKQRQITCI